MVRVDILVLLLNLEERLSAFHYWILCWLCICHKCPFLCWGMFPLFPLWWEFLSWMDVEFCQILFLFYWDDHVIFILPFVDVMLSYRFMIRYWTILASRTIPPDHDILFFLYIVRSDLLIFCWGVLHLYSSEILACNFFFVVSFWFWYLGNGGLLE